MATDKKTKKSPKKATYVKKTNTKKKNTTKKTNTKKYSTKKTTTSKIKKKTIKKQPIKQQDLSDTQLLDIIQIKKAEKKLQKNTPKDDDLIITREIDTSELQQYLQQEQEELENTLLLNELAEKVAERLEEQKNETTTEEVIDNTEEQPIENNKKSTSYTDESKKITISQLLNEDYDKEEDSNEEISEIVNKRNYKESVKTLFLLEK